MSKNKISLSQTELNNMVNIATQHTQEKPENTVVPFSIPTDIKIPVFGTIAACLTVVLAMNVDFMITDTNNAQLNPDLTWADESTFIMELDYMFLDEMDS